MDYFEDKIHDECGVFAMADQDGYNVAKLAYYALFALQHRGQESCGMASNDDGAITCHKEQGLVSDVFTDEILASLKGNMLIGHVRYPNAATKQKENAQPIVSRYAKGTLSVAFNGSIINAARLRTRMENEGAVFATSSDAEVILHMLAKERISSVSIEEALLKVMNQLEGVYSLVVMSPRKILGVRDPYGVHPLCLGKLKNSYILCSESCALNAIGATFLRDVAPGEVIILENGELRTLTSRLCKKQSLCVFEHIYFARPDSVIDGQSVYQARITCGKILAECFPIEADMVMGVPDSGICCAMGYAQQSGIPYGEGLIKNRYIGRTFIQTSQDEREKSVSLKLNVIEQNVRGKRLIVCDDSIVRGTTCANLLNQLRNAGAKEIHMRISSPPFLWPCYFGTDVPSRENLIACQHTLEEIREIIGADTLGFLPLERIGEVAGTQTGICHACFSGEYPMDVSPALESDQREKIKIIY